MTRWRRVRWAALGLAAVGCTSDFGRRDDRNDDPLIGGGSRPANQPVAIVSANPPGGATLAPPSYSPQTRAAPTSTAALASGGFQPLPGSNDLRIGSGSPTLGAPAGAVALQPPAFADPKTTASPTALVSPAPPPGFAPTSATQARGAFDAALALNPRFVQVTYNGESREYTCKISVPNKLNTSIPRIVEASAATEELAIRSALDQLARD